MMKYLFLDTETGGIGLNKSLLTLYMEVTDRNFETLDVFDHFLCPDDGIYLVEGEALSINGIDLREHHKFATPYKEAGQELYRFLQRNCPGKGEHLVPVGHGVKGDIDHIQDKLVSRGTWENFCSHRYLDTSSVCKFLQLKGLLPQELGSLESLKNHFSLAAESHTASGDVYVVKEVLKRFLEIRE